MLIRWRRRVLGIAYGVFRYLRGGGGAAAEAEQRALEVEEEPEDHGRAEER